MKIGNRLAQAREERKLSQAEMADLLGVTPPTYSRLERNETSIDLDQVVNFSKKLEIPIQEFLPETISIYSKNQNSGQGFVLGNIYNYYSDADLQKEKENLENKVKLLEDKIKNLEKIISLLESKK